MQVELLKARAAGGVYSEDIASAPALHLTAPSVTRTTNGAHNFSCSSCGRNIRLECSSASISGGANLSNGDSNNATVSLTALEDTVQRLKAENAQLSAQYAQVAAEICDADAGRQRLELLGTLVSACKSAIARASDTSAPESENSPDVVGDIRMALEMVEAAAQVGLYSTAYFTHLELYIHAQGMITSFIAICVGWWR